MRTTPKDRRLKLGIGLRELARKLGVAPSTLLRWESGEKQPTEKHAKAWERALR